MVYIIRKERYNKNRRQALTSQLNDELQKQYNKGAISEIIFTRTKGILKEEGRGDITDRRRIVSKSEEERLAREARSGKKEVTFPEVLGVKKPLTKKGADFLMSQSKPSVTKTTLKTPK